MAWLLAALALFNLVSMAAVFAPRGKTRKSVPWAQFGFALLATELAWIWLPLQLIIALLLILGGALDSWLGTDALLVLLLTWPGLAWCLWMSSKAESAVRDALALGLGADYLDRIPASRRDKIRSEITFKDWCNPLSRDDKEVDVIRHLPYGPAGIRNQLDIYRPRSIPQGGCPVLLQIHGGAWMMGDKGSQALPLMYSLAKRGWICVAANYRLSPSVSFPTHLLDCKAALCWIREHGEQYGLNTDFVAVTGGSAGGHLTALMGLTENQPQFQPSNPMTDTSVQACIPFYGIYDFLVRYDQHPNRRIYEGFLTGRVLHESLKDNPALWDQASPITHIHNNAPPFMVVHGSHDTLAAISEGRVFSNKLKEVSHNPVVYLEMPGAEHGYEVFHSLRTEHTIEGVFAFLEWVRARNVAASEKVI
ncbi:MAG: alpha/beta hydrolase [Halioglobus sp.]